MSDVELRKMLAVIPKEPLVGLVKGKRNAIEEDGDKASYRYSPPDGSQYGDFSELSSFASI